MGHIVFYLVLALGVLIMPLGLPGTWLILIVSAIFGWATGFAQVTAGILIVLALIALLLEGVEFLLAIKLAQRMGTEKKASWAALAGAIIGGIWATPILPLIGSLIGALAGAFLGAVIWEIMQGKAPLQALQSGLGAFVGRGGAILAKTAGAVAMVIIVLTA